MAQASSSSIRPNKEQFIELMNAPDEGPVTMLNLLKFKAGGGSKEYGKYGDSVVPMVEERGGKVLWMGKVEQTLIGDLNADDWDAIALVQYPSRKAFIDMATSKEYDSAHEHREGGLAKTVLLACNERHGIL
ncbi:MAG TPA: DUF1330 domain-containing protein [Acidimicrobiia bacterium]|nr:DUF1330 domain-containing protein [Acidimicrobiia bacterium]